MTRQFAFGLAVSALLAVVHDVILTLGFLLWERFAVVATFAGAGITSYPSTPTVRLAPEELRPWLHRAVYEREQAGQGSGVEGSSGNGGFSFMRHPCVLPEWTGCPSGLFSKSPKEER